LQFLAGAWDMELSGAAFLPDPDASVHGPVTFESADSGKTWEHHFMVHYSRLAPR
jgi:hypothetical protein